MKQEDINQSNLRHLMDYYVRKFNRAERQLLEAIPFWLVSATVPGLCDQLVLYRDHVANQAMAIKNIGQEEDAPILQTANLPVKTFLDHVAADLRGQHDPSLKNARVLSAVLSMIQFKINMYQLASGFAHSLGTENMYRVFHEAELAETQQQSAFQLLSESIRLDLVHPIRLAG